MERLKITFPSTPLCAVQIPIRITDINYGNHVGNNAIVEIIHEARVQFLAQHGFTEMEVAGTSLIMSELCVEFKNESFYVDLLDVKLFAGGISRVSFELLYEIATKRNGKPITIAHAKTGMVCYNYQARKVSSVPAELRSILEK